MPRSVRPVWMDLATSDGREVGTGPSRRDGGLDATLRIRERGEVADCLSINGRGAMAGTKVHVWVSLKRLCILVLLDGTRQEVAAGSSLYVESEQ